MATSWRRVDFQAVLRSWAIAEATSDKEAGFSGAVRQQAPSLHAKLLRGDALSESELNAIANAIKQYRAPMLAGLLPLDPAWYEGAVSIETLSEMRIFNLPAWVARTPSRSLSEHCGAPQPRSSSEPEFRGFRNPLERIIAVGVTQDEPFCLLEGYTRGCAMIRDHKAGLRVETVPVYLGVTPRIAEWSDGRGWLWW